MSLIKYESDFLSASQWLADFWNDWGESSSFQRKPAMNIQETSKAFLVDIAAPGLKKSDFEISLDEDILSISYSHEGKREDENEQQLIRKEFTHFSWKRSLRLPTNVETAKIHATYEEGVLRVSVPKSEHLSKKKVISIK